MNILLINHYAGSTQYGMEYRPHYLAREWVQLGHSVQILSASYSHIRTKQPKMIGMPILKENIDGINYHWYATPAYTGNGLGRVRNMLVFLWNIWTDTKNIGDSFKPDVVIASSTYPMDIWPARRIAKRANAQLIFEVHDLWPLSPIELGGMSRWHPFIMWCQWAEDYAYRYANKVVSMLPKAKKHMVSRGMLPEKFHYIPNGIDTKEWDSVQPLPLDILAELKLIKQRGIPIIGYTGTHGLANSLDTLLDVAKDGIGQFEVVLVGTGPDRKRLLQRVADEEIKNVNMFPAIPKSSIPAFLSIIDIAFIGWHNNPLYRFGISPNKLMDYMMAEKPIVHSVKAGNDPVTEAGCGITVAPGDATAIREAILNMIKMGPEVWKKMGGNGRRFILEKQTYPILAQHFLQVIET